MNTSNPFGTETIARERQAEIEKQLRQEAQLKGLRPARASSPVKRRFVIALTSLTIVGLLATIVAMQLH